jgi:hypothetical protein
MRYLIVILISVVVLIVTGIPEKVINSLRGWDDEARKEFNEAEDAKMETGIAFEKFRNRVREAEALSGIKPTRKNLNFRV